MRSTSSCTLLVALLCLWLALPADADGDNRRVEHIVIVWLKEPGNSAARDRIIEASTALTAIPGVVSLKSGSVMASDRPIVDSSFDVGLIITLVDEAALQAYLTHPLHLTLVEETLKPLVERIQVYDFR
ncbi:MAG: Dabb family protein [Gammaproteobacteria bacterium]|nr:Dabb family protein [Gammaproteobacteria bacterium]